MNKEKLLEHLTGQYEYCYDTAKESDCDVWETDTIAIKQAIEMCKMLYVLFDNFGGKGELYEYCEMLEQRGFDADLINEIIKDC